ncbi:hypothetical protein ACFORJ_02775 [Corynebacterium hansenii]|uniref:Anti-sigma-D factor RsdA sigma factor binding region domain-containing protein n=1 Tax=Corynebacterium hansenii TaxID=394964 RepID=A0ABV7ZNR1_9CORY|nr:hypothetical protein [Corynebacterium hansenii]WJY99078.1 hypothetical protein CHAN_02235 [Corynebacterium hansenii]
MDDRQEKEAAMGDQRDPRRARWDDAAAGVEKMPTPQELAADDRFLDALASGRRDVCGAGVYGTDSYLASLITDARESIGAELPPLPEIDPSVAVPDRDVVDVEVVAAEEDVESERESAVAHGSGNEAPLAGATEPRSEAGGVLRGPATWWKPSRLGSALIGAAASLTLVAGGLSAIHSAAPGSALWPARVAMFGERSVEMDLAATLQEADAAGRAGDVERARELLEHAERLMAKVGESNRPALESQMRETVERVRTVTRAPETVTNERTTTQRETQTLEPGTTTRTETRTETVTETVTRPNEPTQPTQPTTTSNPASEPLSNERPTKPTTDPEAVRSALTSVPETVAPAAAAAIQRF